MFILKLDGLGRPAYAWLQDHSEEASGEEARVWTHKFAYRVYWRLRWASVADSRVVNIIHTVSARSLSRSETDGFGDLQYVSARRLGVFGSFSASFTSGSGASG